MAVITRIHIEVRPLAGDTDCSACEPTDKDAERGAPATCHVAVGPSWAMVTFDLCDQCRALLAARVWLGEWHPYTRQLQHVASGRILGGIDERGRIWIAPGLDAAVRETVAGWLRAKREEEG